jgi:hypothetical protein
MYLALSSRNHIEPGKNNKKRKKKKERKKEKSPRLPSPDPENQD